MTLLILLINYNYMKYKPISLTNTQRQEIGTLVFDKINDNFMDYLKNKPEIVNYLKNIVRKEVYAILGKGNEIDDGVDKQIDLTLKENQFFNYDTKKQYKGIKIINDCKKHSFNFKDMDNNNFYGTEKQFFKHNRRIKKEEKENYLKFSIPIMGGRFIVNKYYNFCQTEELTSKEKLKRRLEVREKQRFRILKRDNFTCKYCGKSIKNYPELQLEIDHIIPVSKGGTNEDSNLICACRECNLGKSND